MTIFFGQYFRLPENFQISFGFFALNLLLWILSVFILGGLIQFLLKIIVFKNKPISIVVLDFLSIIKFLLVIIGSVSAINLLDFSASNYEIERPLKTLVVIVGAYYLYPQLTNITIQLLKKLSSIEEVGTIYNNFVRSLAKWVVIIVASIASGFFIALIWGVGIVLTVATLLFFCLVLVILPQTLLSNIASGFLFLIENPTLNKGEMLLQADMLVLLKDIGLTVTHLYNLDKQLDIFLPNNQITTTEFINLSRDNGNLKVSIKIGVAYGSNVDQVTKLLSEIVNSHPNVLGSIASKTSAMEKKIVELQDLILGKNVPNVKDVEEKIQEHQIALSHLYQKNEMNQHVVDLTSTLRQVSNNQKSFTLIDEQINILRFSILKSGIAVDPWESLDENTDRIKNIIELNDEIVRKWDIIKLNLKQENNSNISTLDQEIISDFDRWIYSEYQIVPPVWQNPDVRITDFGAQALDFEVDFFIENIAAENWKRQDRILNEIRETIIDKFNEEAVVIPFPQTELWFRDSAQTSIPLNNISGSIDSHDALPYKEHLENHVESLIYSRDQIIIKVNYSWDVFVSYASEDRAFVEDIVRKLKVRKIKVWYDQINLEPGESLRGSIDEGLLRSKFGLIILSHNYFRKEWPKKELGGLVARIEHNIIIPVWYNITEEDVKRFAPTLCELAALRADEGIDQIVRRITLRVRKGYD